MVLGAREGQRDDFILLGGKRYPLKTGTTVVATPSEAYAPSITIGDPSEQVDQRFSEVAFTSWTNGCGAYLYSDETGVDSFTESDCDTRFQHALVCRPLLGGLGTNTLPAPTAPWQILAVDLSSVILMALTRSAAAGQAVYALSGNAWTVPATLSDPSSTGIVGHGFFAGNFLVMRGYTGNTQLLKTTDGLNWSGVNPTGQAAGALYGIGVHDNKVYFWDSADGKVYYITTITGPVVTAATTNGLVLLPGEVFQQFIEWRDRYGRRALYFVTNFRLLGLDDDSLAWQHFYTLPGAFHGAQQVYAYVWPTDDNLYLSAINNTSTAYAPDGVLQLTGSTISVLSPNKQGGLAAANQMQCGPMAGNPYCLGVWGPTVPSGGGGGRAMVVNSDQGWHTFLRGGAAQPVQGGGMGNGEYWTVLNGQLYQQDLPAQSAIPQHAVGRTYDTNACLHETAWITFGTDHITKAVLWLYVDAILPDGSETPGVPTTATILCEYQIDGSNTWVTLATLNNASTWPAVVQFAGGTGVACKRIKIRLTLTRGSGSGDTPLVRDFSLHAVRQPVKRMNYRCQLDLRGERLAAGDSGNYYGRTAAQMRADLYALWKSYTPTTLQYNGEVTGSGPNLVSVTGDVTFQEGTLAQGGPGVISLTVRDLTSPASGLLGT